MTCLVILVFAIQLILFEVQLKFDELPAPKDRVHPRDTHSECNIPAPVGSGLVPDRKGSGVGSVTSTPRDNVHTQSTENVILEKCKDNLWGKYPTPALKRAGMCVHTFCSRQIDATH